MNDDILNKLMLCCQIEKEQQIVFLFDKNYARKKIISKIDNKKIKNTINKEIKNMDDVLLIVDFNFRIFWFNYKTFNIEVENEIIIQDISLFCKNNLKEFQKINLDQIMTNYVMGYLHDGVKIK